MRGKNGFVNFPAGCFRFAGLFSGKNSSAADLFPAVGPLPAGAKLVRRQGGGRANFPENMPEKLDTTCRACYFHFNSSE